MKYCTVRGAHLRIRPPANEIFILGLVPVGANVISLLCLRAQWTGAHGGMVGQMGFHRGVALALTR